MPCYTTSRYEAMGGLTVFRIHVFFPEFWKHRLQMDANGELRYEKQPSHRFEVTAADPPLENLVD